MDGVGGAIFDEEGEEGVDGADEEDDNDGVDDEEDGEAAAHFHGVTGEGLGVEEVDGPRGGLVDEYGGRRG